LLGPYEVGVIQRRIPGSTASQIFYPAAAAAAASSSSSASTKDGTAYFRPKAVSGLADYTRQTEDLLQFLSNRDHPCLVNAPPLQGGEHKKDGYPIVVFSHGLGGCMEMYTDLCQQVASAGMIVVAMEHEDGSGCFAETQAGEEILYKRPDDTPYSRQKVVNFRRPFLRHRVDETIKAMEFLLGEWRNEQTMTNDPLFTQVLESSTDPSKGVALFGHSFGGASMALATATMQESSSAKQTFINSLTMLDPWAFSLEDKMLQEGIPSSIPFLSILSEGWLTNPERYQILELHASNPSKLFYMPRSRHASFSDSAWWLPRFVTRRMGLRGPEEPRHETVRSCANACVQHITTAMRRYEDNSSPNVVDVDDKEEEEDYAPLLPFPSFDKMSQAGSKRPVLSEAQ
jgi:predicted dienelactone hydrolase